MTRVGVAVMGSGVSARLDLLAGVDEVDEGTAKVIGKSAWVVAFVPVHTHTPCVA